MTKNPKTPPQEFFFEHLPRPTQERLTQMALFPFDPLRLPYKDGFSLLRFALFAILGVSFLPGFLDSTLFVLSLLLSALAALFGFWFATYLDPSLPSFWYLHTAYLIRHHEGNVKVFSWSGLRNAHGAGCVLQLFFEDETAVIYCPEGDASEYAQYAFHLAKNSRTVLERNPESVLWEKDALPFH